MLARFMLGFSPPRHTWDGTVWAHKRPPHVLTPPSGRRKEEGRRRKKRKERRKRVWLCLPGLRRVLGICVVFPFTSPLRLRSFVCSEASLCVGFSFTGFFRCPLLLAWSHFGLKLPNSASTFQASLLPSLLPPLPFSFASSFICFFCSPFVALF